MKQAQPITEFFKRPAPVAGIILGKGPSLDKYDPSMANGAYVLALNNVPMALPCDAALFADPHYADMNLAPEVDVLRLARYRHSHNGRGYIFGLSDAVGRMEGQSKTMIPFFGYGSLTMAVTILGEWGVKRISFWGCDSLSSSGDGMRHAACVAATSKVPPNPIVTSVVVSGTMAALDHYKIDWTLN